VLKLCSLDLPKIRHRNKFACDFANFLQQLGHKDQEINIKYKSVHISGYICMLVCMSCCHYGVIPHTHTRLTALFRDNRVSRYQKGKTNMDFTEARDSGWQWHQLDHMQVCPLLQTDNHTSTPTLLCFLQAGCPSGHPKKS